MTDISDCKFVVYDCETTGLDTSQDRIIEFGATVFERRQIRGRGRALCNPGIPIAPEAQAVHGIGDERVRDCPPFAGILHRIQAAFDSAPMILGFNNIRFDDAMINTEAERAGSSWRVPADKVLDLLVFVNWFHRGDRPRTQEAIAVKYGLDFEGKAHSAAADTQMTGELFLVMVDAGIIPDTVEDAMAEQARLSPVIEREFEAWGPWLYRDRKTQRLRMGAGKHCGKYLTDVGKGTLSWYVSNIDDLPAQTRAAFESAKSGKSHDEIQESMFSVSGSDDTAAADVDDVAGWGG